MEGGGGRGVEGRWRSGGEGFRLRNKTPGNSHAGYV